MSPDVTISNGKKIVSDEFGGKYIVHKVSKMDTLAGIAIKYGVEVSDIRKLNNLATDLQIFALKTLLIPLPGRHPPSPCLSNGSSNLPNGSASPGETSSRNRAQIGGWTNVLEPMQSLSAEATKKRVSPAMSTLQSYYGLRPPNCNGKSDSTSTSVYRTRSSDYLEDRMLLKSPLIADLISKCHLESQTSVDDFMGESSSTGPCAPPVDSGDVEIEMSNNIFVRRRQKAEADPRAGSSERYLKGCNGGMNSTISPLTGKTLAMRKASSRAELSANSETGCLTSTLVDNDLGAVRKSSSTPSFLDQESGNSTSIWPTLRWNLKPDLQALSATAITRPIFDNLPKPFSRSRKAK